MPDTIAHTAGEVIEVRCNLNDCPAPIIGLYLPEYYEPATADTTPATGMYAASSTRAASCARSQRFARRSERNVMCLVSRNVPTPDDVSAVALSCTKCRLEVGS